MFFPAPPWKPNASTPSPAPSQIAARERGNCGGIFDFDTKQTRLAEVARELENPDVWQDAKRAQDLGREKKQLEGTVASIAGIDSRLRDAAALFSPPREENDDDTLVAVETD